MVYIGIDLGGTKISAAVFKEDLNISAREKAYLQGRSGDQVKDLIISLCSRLCSRIESGDALGGIGICVPGIVSSSEGAVWAPNIPGWDWYPLTEELRKAFPECSIVAESDRSCYILGENGYGEAKGCKNAVYVSVGTGIGAGIMVDGRVLHGFSDIAGATGWMALEYPYSPEWDSCGCFETSASGNGISKQAEKQVIINKDYSGPLKKRDGGKISTEEVFTAYQAGDPVASMVIEKAIKLWGMASANFISLLNPEIIIFGGGVFGPASKYLHMIALEAEKWAQPIAFRQCRFAVSALAQDAGLYGAAVSAIKAVKVKI